LIENELKPFLDKLAEILGDKLILEAVEIVCHCPYCDQKAIGKVANNSMPRAEDVTICPNCFNMLCFNEELNLIKFTPEFWQALGEKRQRNLKMAQQEIIKKESKHGQE